MKNYVITIDLGGTNTRFALMSEYKNLSAKIKRGTPQNMRSLESLITKELTQITQKHKSKNILGVGVSVAGLVNHSDKSFYLTAAKSQITFFKKIEQKIGLPIHLVNDTKSAVLAVHEYELPRKNNISYVTISTGIGVGSIISGHLLHGNHKSTGSAGELGHSVVHSPFTDEAHSWEHYIAGKRDDNKGILRFYQKWAIANNVDLNPKYKQPKDLFTAHAKKAKDIKGFMNEVGKINAQGVANVMFAYDPEVIVFGGSIAYHNFDVIVAGIRKHIRRDLIKPLPRFIRTELGDNAPLLGAGLWAFKNLK